MDIEKIKDMDIEKIRESLIEQANSKGFNDEFILDKIDSYCSYIEFLKEAKKGITIEEIRQSLIEQANRKGANVAFIEDQIDTYCRYTELEKEALKDIKENGTTIKMTSSVGKVSERVNPAIKTALMYSKQRLDILKRLNLSLDTVAGDNTEDSDI